MIGKGQVYKITSEHTEKCYIGSTKQKLNKRFCDHRCKTNCMSRILFELGECKIEALEVLYNITKQELKIKEQYYLDLLKDKAVNKNKADPSKEHKQKENQKHSLNWYYRKIQNPEFREKIAKEARDRRKAKENNPV